MTFRDQIALESRVAKSAGVKAIDPEAWFCVDQRCPAVVGNVPAYADGEHLTAEYSTKIGPAVVAAILK